MSSETPFSVLIDKTLSAIEDALDASGIDVDTSRSGQVLAIEFDDGSKIIVNGQEPMQELWVAARAGGFHFRHEANGWQDSRGAGELFACLSKWVSAQAGQAVLLASR